MLSTYLKYLTEQEHNIEIKLLNKSDAESIVDILNHCFPQEKFTKQRIENSMGRAKPDLYYGAFYDGILVGAMLIYPMDNRDSQRSLYMRYRKNIKGDLCFEDKIPFSKFKPEILLQNFCIQTKWRGLNIGNKMMEFITKKHKRIFLQTDTKTSPQAHHLYRKFGFKDIDCMSPPQFFYKDR